MQPCQICGKETLCLQHILSGNQFEEDYPMLTPQEKQQVQMLTEMAAKRLDGVKGKITLEQILPTIPQQAADLAKRYKGTANVVAALTSELESLCRGMLAVV